MSIRCGNRNAHGRAVASHETIAQVKVCNTVRPVDSIEETEQAEQWLAEAAGEQAAEQAATRYFENQGFWEARADEDRERAMGVVPFHEAMAAAEREMAAAEERLVNPSAEQFEVLGPEAALRAVNPDASDAEIQAYLVSSGMVDEDTSNRQWTLYDGIYTLEGDGGHRTFRVRTQGADADFAPGKTVIGYLSGPDNERDYTGFGFVFDGPLTSRVAVWSRFKDNTELVAAAEALAANPQAALQEAKCRRCHRRLTVPVSLFLGYGPECAKRINS